MKWLYNILFVIILTIIFHFSSFNLFENVFTAFYTVCGVLFPIAISQIMSFSFSEVENDKFVEKYRSHLNLLRKKFIAIFCVITVFFIIGLKSNMVIFKTFEIKTLSFAVLVFGVIYFTLNFIELAKLKDEIEDIVRKQKKS